MDSYTTCGAHNRLARLKYGTEKRRPWLVLHKHSEIERKHLVSCLLLLLVGKISLRTQNSIQVFEVSGNISRWRLWDKSPQDRNGVSKSVHKNSTFSSHVSSSGRSWVSSSGQVLLPVSQKLEDSFLTKLKPSTYGERAGCVPKPVYHLWNSLRSFPISMATCQITDSFTLTSLFYYSFRKIWIKHKI